MNRLIFVALLAAMLAGCAAGGGAYKPNPYLSETGSPTDWSKPYYGDRYWPPVDPNSAFPPQIMRGGGRDR